MTGYLKTDADNRLWFGNGEQRSLCRLDLGQNNDGCAPEVAQKLTDMFASQVSQSFLQCYPPFGATRLHQKIAMRHGLPCDSVLITAGIEQAIGMIADACLKPGETVVLTDPTFFLFGRVSSRAGAKPVHVALNLSDRLAVTYATVDRLSETVKSVHPKILWLANPNNPTGIAVPNEILKEIIQITAANDCILVVDEAYGEYVDPDNDISSASAYFNAYSHIVVLRTFSKAFGLAGLRIGYMLASNRALRDRLLDYGTNFPVTGLSIEAALTALDHPEHLSVTRRQTLERRQRLFSAFKELPDITALPTDSCIYLLRHNRVDANQLRLALEKQGVITAGIPGESSASQSHIRVTLGLESDNHQLYESLKQILHDPIYG